MIISIGLSYIYPFDIHMFLLLFTQSCLTLCTPVDCSTSGSSALFCPLELAQIHVHWVSDAAQPSYPVSSLPLLPSIFSGLRVFSKELTLCIRWPKNWSFITYSFTRQIFSTYYFRKWECNSEQIKQKTAVLLDATSMTREVDRNKQVKCKSVRLGISSTEKNRAVRRGAESVVIISVDICRIGYIKKAKILAKILSRWAGLISGDSVSSRGNRQRVQTPGPRAPLVCLKALPRDQSKQRRKAKTAESPHWGFSLYSIGQGAIKVLRRGVIYLTQWQCPDCCFGNRL